MKTSSLQDLMTLFMVSRMPITTWRSCSVRTVSTMQGSTTSSSFRRAGGDIQGMRNWVQTNSRCTTLMSDCSCSLLFAMVYNLTVYTYLEPTFPPCCCSLIILTQGESNNAHFCILFFLKHIDGVEFLRKNALPWWLASVGFSFQTRCWARQNWPMAPIAALRTSSWGN